MRPNTLNVCRDKTDNDTNKFIREALHAWRAKSRRNIVPADRLHDLFAELHFSPTEKQINEMLATAKQFARRGSSLEACIVGSVSNGSVAANSHGLTFGEFCVLVADLKRFRTSSAAAVTSSTSTTTTTTTTVDAFRDCDAPTFENGTGDGPSTAPEVFLGGSCNPTTWRADVAIPALDRLGISFYNPQVSDWTPDLIELEHRAKEKARVLFFVMDSETRATAGSIEAAHIAGQNARHLVLVLHPYQVEQSILNERISDQEFVDLQRNQQLLRQLVSSRGLPVLDNIPSGLQRTRAILAGTSERQAPQNIAARLISVRRAFDRLANPAGRITIGQCQSVLPGLGYAHNLLSTDNLCHVLRTNREAVANTASEANGATPTADSVCLTFDEFCIMAAHLTVLQQEIHESGCVSPIKGTNLPQPPIYLTNQLEFAQKVVQRAPDHDRFVGSTTVLRTSSCKSVPEDQRRSGVAELYRTALESSASAVSAAASDDCDDESTAAGGVRLRPKPVPAAGEMRDIYLGGSCSLRTKWRYEIAVPVLEQRAMSYYLPEVHLAESTLRPASWRNAYDDDEALFDAGCLEASRVLLFVVTNETRSLVPMTLAAHYIGLGYDVVLCVQMLPEFCMMGSEKLTPAAIKDYNRGRAYLTDLAKRQGVPVFSDIRESIDCAVEKVRTYSSRNSI